MCHHDHDHDDHKNTPPHSWALNFNLCHILDPLMSNFAEISICPPPNYSKTMMTCSKIKSLPPKGVYYSLFQSIDAATLTTDWEAKPDQSVVIICKRQEIYIFLFLCLKRLRTCTFTILIIFENAKIHSQK